MLSGGSFEHFQYYRQLYVYALVLTGYCKKFFNYDNS